MPHSTENDNPRMRALENAAERTARALLRRRDVRVVIGQSASYDGESKILTLPTLAAEPATPILANAWRGVLDHEVGHAEHSDFSVLRREIDKWRRRHGDSDTARMKVLANVFEDPWMERAWSAENPGSRAHFAASREYWHARTGGIAITDPGFVPPGGSRPMGAFGAFTQAVLRVATGSMRMDEVHTATRELMDRCMPQIEAGWAAFSTSEACSAAEALWARMEEIAAEAEEAAKQAAEEGGGPGGGADTVPAGAGGDPHGAPEAVGGEWGECPGIGEVVGKAVGAGLPRGGYTVDPASAAKDRVIDYDPKRRSSGRASLVGLRAAAGPAAAKLTALLRQAVRASRQSLVVGGLEDGEDLDEAAVASIATRSGQTDVFATEFRQIVESSFVCVLVDCSGSMGSSTPQPHCKVHGLRYREEGTCKTDGCGQPLRLAVSDPAGHAAITAMALHDALRGAKIPHAVLGHTTHGSTARDNPRDRGGLFRWSRQHDSLEMHVFVPAPGLNDDGAAIPFITGRNNNLDGEALLWAARYAADRGGPYDRVILLYVADGLPAGADDDVAEKAHVLDSVDRIAKAGIETYGIGVGMGYQWDTFKEFFPDRREVRGRAPTGHTKVDNADGLTDGVLRELTGLLTRGYGQSRRVSR